MWILIISGILVVAILSWWFIFRSRNQSENYDDILQHLDDKIFPGGETQKKDGGRHVMKLLKNKINIQEAEELYVHKISLFYFEKYDSNNDSLILHLTKFENSKVDFFDKIELYNFFTQEHLRYNKQNWIDGFALHEIILNARGKAVDYRFLDVNADFENLTGLKKTDVIGRTIKQIFPGIDEFWISTYGKVATKGELAKFDHFDQSLNKHFAVSAYSPRPNRFISFLSEIKSTQPKLINISA
ncbi:MAG: hypothetical protein U9R19_12410 [Bacteroidota bacterium]|nr:hypothetical protein [Bacteroidota bacterium]